ncbi:MAG: amidase [Rhodospirillaceae bacterium]|nr:amidase [Rhodospirillaceae bacterium]
MTDTAFSTVTDLIDGFASGALSPVAVMDRYLEQIATYDDKLHAFVAVYANDARMAAEAAEKAQGSGHRVGPLHGVPIAMKDIIDMEGRVTTGGSMPWCDRISTTTATLVERLVASGIIVIGKTHTVEFAMGGWGTNQHMGTPWNPWDVEVHRTPGGSSAGSGVSVAAGMAPCAIGTDTGGSVRLPAAWCGLVGLKTTIGRISTHGVLPLASTLDTPGPMCRTVEDAALIYNAMQGPDPKDPHTKGVHFEDPLPQLRRGVSGLRLARMGEREREIVDAEVLAAYDASLECLAGQGAKIVDVTLPGRFTGLGAVTGKIIGAEGYLFVGDRVDDMSLQIDEDVRPRIWVGKEMSAREYLEILHQREEIKRAYDEALCDVDAYLTPTTATPAIPLSEVDQDETPATFTRVVNLLDRCALSIPNGITAHGLPTSLQIMCDAYDETMALRIGFAFQEATNWVNRVPKRL